MTYSNLLDETGTLLRRPVAPGERRVVVADPHGYRYLPSEEADVEVAAFRTHSHLLGALESGALAADGVETLAVYGGPSLDLDRLLAAVYGWSDEVKVVLMVDKPDAKLAREARRYGVTLTQRPQSAERFASMVSALAPARPSVVDDWGETTEVGARVPLGGLVPVVGRDLLVPG